MSSIRSPVFKRAEVDAMDVDQTVSLSYPHSISTIAQRKQTYHKVDLYCPHPFLLALAQQAKVNPAPRTHAVHRRHDAISTSAGFPSPRSAASSGHSTWFVGQSNPVTPPRQLLPRAPPPRPARPVQVNSNSIPRNALHSDVTVRQLVHPIVPVAPPHLAHPRPPLEHTPPNELLAIIHRILHLVEDVRPSDISALAPLFACMFWQIRRYYRYLRLNGRQMAVMSMIARITANCIPPGTRTNPVIDNQGTLRELTVQLERRCRSRVPVRPITIPSNMVQSDGSASADTSSSAYTPADSPVAISNTASSVGPSPDLPPSADPNLFSSLQMSRFEAAGPRQNPQIRSVM